MKNLLLSVVMVFAGLLAGCSSGSGPITLTSIQVSPPTASVAAGLPQAFTATGKYSNNSTQDLTATATWASSNTAVATIAGGSATTLTQGSTTITATMSGVVGTAALTVTAPVLESIAVTPANASVPLGTLTQFTATGTRSDKSTLDLTKTATWASSNTTVATIAAGGLTTALTISSAPITITATSGSVSGNTGLSVVPATLTSIVITGGPTVTLANGTSFAFTALGFYNDGSKRNITSQVTWSSSLTTVAKIVPTNGLAHAVGSGSTTITATLGSVNQSVTLDVTTAIVTSIVVSPSSRTLARLTAQPFTAIGIFNDSSTQNITRDVVWSSSNTAVATIGNTSGSIGVATAVAFGPTTISATFEGVNGSAPLNVSSATLTSIAVTPASAGLAPGSILELQAIGTFSDGTKQPIESVATWTSSATAVATVNAVGVVKGVANGPVTITCQLGGVSNTASLTVEAVTTIAISPGNGSVAQDTAIGLKATGTLTDKTTQDLTSSVLWTSSNPSVATVSDAQGSIGSAAGSAPGVATVTAAFAGQVGVATLTVTNATLSSITIKPANPSIALGTQQQFAATGKFSDGTTESLGGQVAWSSSEITVAIINNTGAVSTTGKGTTTIEAALGGVSDTTVLTVH
jgi:trimeric autotransporter adhesin